MSELSQATRKLLTFTLKADRQMLMALVEVTPEALSRETGSGYSSVLGTMSHTLAMERVWLSRFMGNPVDYFDSYETFDSLREGFHEFWSECEFFVASLTDDQLVADVVWSDFDGEVRSQPLWQVVLVFAQHATHHRGQIASLLRQLGYEPPISDMNIYFRGA
jgi:uncharacterized damage-inducible protein DinB